MIKLIIFSHIIIFGIFFMSLLHFQIPEKMTERKPGSRRREWQKKMKEKMSKKMIKTKKKTIRTKKSRERD